MFYPVFVCLSVSNFMYKLYTERISIKMLSQMCHSTMNTIRLHFVHICIIKIRKLKKNFQLTALFIVYHCKCKRSLPFTAVA